MLEPITFLKGAAVLCAALAFFLILTCGSGVVFLCEPSEDLAFTVDPSPIGSLQTAEAADAVLDLIVWWAT